MMPGAPPENHHGQGPDDAGVALAGPLIAKVEDVPAGQADGGGHEQEIERRQQTLLQIAPGLQKGGMKHSVEGQNAPQQGSEFSEFQKHGRHSRRDPLDFVPLQPPARGRRAMGKERGYTGLLHGAHVVELFFLAFERSAQELFHRHAGGRLATRPHPQERPSPRDREHTERPETLAGYVPTAASY